MIKFGMSLPQIFNQLVKGYQKVKGIEPKGLDLIKIKQEAMSRFKDMNKVVDMQGRTLDPSKTIMGGTQEGAALKSGIMKATGAKPIEARADISKYIKDGKPDNDKLNALVDRDMILKEEADSLATKGENYERFQQISAERKNIREIIEDVRKMFTEDMAQGGRIGYKDGMLKRGLKAITGTDTYKTLEDKTFNAAVFMNEGFDAIYNLLSGVPGLAEGGRIGYKDGPDKPGRRKFMKMAAGIASLIPGLGMIGKGAKVAAPVVAKTAEITGPALAKLVDTVMSAGKLISLTGTRVKNMVTKKKLGKVEVEEDIADGSYIIKKDGKEIYYKPGRMDESGIEDDIIEVIEDRVKKAGGGIGYMLGE